VGGAGLSQFTLDFTRHCPYQYYTVYGNTGDTEKKLILRSIMGDNGGGAKKGVFAQNSIGLTRPLPGGSGGRVGRGWGGRGLILQYIRRVEESAVLYQ